MAAARKKATGTKEKSEVAGDDREESVESRPVSKWPTKVVAARILGKSVTTIQRMLRRGELVAQPDEGGVWRFDPDELDQMAAEQRESDTLGAAALIESGANLVTQAHDHVEALVKHVTGPGLSILELQNSLLKTMSDENAKLREKNFEMLEMREKAQSQQHERDMASEMVKADQARKNQAWEMMIKLLPGLVAKLASNLGQGKQLKSVVDALVEIPDEFVDVFAKMDILKPDQLEAIKKLREAHPGRAKTLAELEAAAASKEASEPAVEAPPEAIEAAT